MNNLEIKDKKEIKIEKNGNEETKLELITAIGKDGKEIKFYSYERVWIKPETNRERVQKRLTFGEKDKEILSKMLKY